MSAPLAPGFSRPVEQAQTVFRAVLEAMSRPGLPVVLEDVPPTPPGAAFTPAFAALALTLCDTDTPVWLDAPLDTPEVRDYLRFHCGVRFAARPEDALFAFAAAPAGMPDLDRFSPGTNRSPDQSCTLFLRAGLRGAGPRLRLSGPGIRGAALCCAVDGLPHTFWTYRARNAACFPAGTDALLLDDAPGTVPLLLGLPRTTRATPEPEPSPSCTSPAEEPVCTLQ